MATYKITLYQSNWTGGMAAFYYDTNTAAFYPDTDLATEMTGLTSLPERETYRFNGFYEKNSTTSPGIQYIDDAGNFTEALYLLAPTSAKTLYVNGTRVSYRLTVNDNGGSGGDGTLYYRIDGGGYFRDHLCSGDEVTRFTPPIRTGFEFKGYYSSASSTVQYAIPDGSFTDEFADVPLSADKTIYAQWIAPYKITISANGGTGGTTAFYFGSISGKFYASEDCSQAPIARIEPHVRETFAFLGCYKANSTSSTQHVAPDGTILAGWSPSANVTLYCQWLRVSWKVTFSKQGGEGGSDCLYYRIDGGGYYLDDLVVGETNSVAPPKRAGYGFSGYYASTSPNADQYVTPDGTFTTDIAELSVSSAKTFYAQWTANTYTITFDANGGRCEVESKTVTFGEAVGELPSPLHGEGYFIAWTMGGSPLTADTVWKIDRDAIAIASWDYHFGRKRDFFFLDGDSLACIESADGCEMSAVETSHDGALAIQMEDSDVGAYRIYGRKLNPVVTYRVIGAASISLTLGKAYAMATRSSSKITIDGVSRYVAEESGYMLTAFEYRTGADKIPTLTLFGAANEGYVHNSSGVMTPKLTDAINMWTVKFDVSPDHASQDVFGAIDGGGELLSCTTRGECTPVVPLELGMPCASDVVRGKLLVSAQTAAYGGEDAPTARAPFLAVQVNESNSDIDFISYNIRAERSLN